MKILIITLIVIFCYVLIGTFIGSILDNNPHPLSVIFWPCIVVGFTIWFALEITHRLGNKIGNIFKRS